MTELELELTYLVRQVPKDLEDFESKIIERLGFARIVTPTRLHGLLKLEEAIRAFARSSKLAQAP